MLFSQLEKLTAKKLVFVNLIYAPNDKGEDAYCFFSVTGDGMLKLHQDLRRKQYIDPKDYGYIIKEGLGYPPPEVIKEMEEKYNYKHSEHAPLNTEEESAA